MGAGVYFAGRPPFARRSFPWLGVCALGFAKRRDCLLCAQLTAAPASRLTNVSTRAAQAPHARGHQHSAYPPKPTPHTPHPTPQTGNATYSHNYSAGQANNAGAGLRGAGVPSAAMMFGLPPGMLGPGMGSGMTHSGAAPRAGAPAPHQGHQWKGQYAMLLCRVTLGRIEVRVGWLVGVGGGGGGGECVGAAERGDASTRNQPADLTNQQTQTPRPNQIGRPGMRICNPGFHGVSNSGAQRVTNGANDIYAVFDNHQCFPEYLVHYDVNA